MLTPAEIERESGIAGNCIYFKTPYVAHVEWWKRSNTSFSRSFSTSVSDPLGTGYIENKVKGESDVCKLPNCQTGNLAIFNATVNNINVRL